MTLYEKSGKMPLTAKLMFSYIVGGALLAILIYPSRTHRVTVYVLSVLLALIVVRIVVLCLRGTSWTQEELDING